MLISFVFDAVLNGTHSISKKEVERPIARLLKVFLKLLKNGLNKCQ